MTSAKKFLDSVHKGTSVKGRCIHKGDEKIVLISLFGIYKSKNENDNYEAEYMAIFSPWILHVIDIFKTIVLMILK